MKGTLTATNSTPSRRSRRTAIYCRVSTEEQAEEGYSLDDQERAGRLYVAARVAMGADGSMGGAAWTEIEDGDVFLDPGVSGTARDRPLGLTPLLEACAAGRYARVVCTKLDRIGRTASLIMAIEDDFDRCGVERVYIKDGIDTSTATGRLLRTVLAAVAELERDMILERTRAGYEGKARAGDIFRSRHVFGYRYIPGDKKARIVGRLEIHEPEAVVVRRIMRDLIAGVSMSQLCVDLNTEGVPTMRGGRWAHATIRYIINNPVYWGQAAYGRTAMVKRGGQRVRRANPSPDAVQTIAGETIPAIVDEDLARVAQRAVAGNRTFSKRNAAVVYMLRGLLRCGRCDPPTAMGGGAGVYQCHHATPEGKRTPHRVGQRKVEGVVRAHLRELIVDHEDRLDAQEDLNRDALRARADAAATLVGTRAELARQDDRGRRYLELYGDGALSKAAWITANAGIEKERARVLGRIATLEAARDAATADLAPTEEIRRMCADLSSRIDTFDDEEWQQVARRVIRVVIVHEADVEIHGALTAWDAVLPLAPSSMTLITDRRWSRCCAPGQSRSYA